MKKSIYLLISLFIIILLSACGEAENSGQIENLPSSESKAKESLLEDEKTSAQHSVPDRDLKVHFIDVGQGDSTLLQFSDHEQEYAILIDAGDFTGTEVIDYLKKEKIKVVHLAIGTHPDADHIGQLDEVIHSFDVGEVWLSGNNSDSDTFAAVLEAINREDVNYHEPRSGEQYDIGPLALYVLHPKEITGDGNKESISIKIVYGNISFIFTGDASIESEKEMIDRGMDLKADFLHLGHHGAATSTSERFLEAVSPKIAIYSAGADNPYGHPDIDVINRIKSRGIKIYGTDIHGTIVVATDGRNFTINTEREEKLQNKTVSDNETGKQNDEPNKKISENGCIDINNAPIEELEKIIHIGPERAKEVMEGRPYQSVDDLIKIKGIGKARIADIKEQDLACVGGS